MKIKLLENHMIEKIAAGEVVESPSSAVKELVENSIDSGANEITIEISKGGKDLIRVVDNGSGIEEDDLENVFKRHATSKIANLEDLENVISLGFRGEAMAAIAAVSRITLYTKTGEEIGNLIELRGGEINKKEKIACPKGTTVSVRNLFFNVPARKKFLKSNSIESSKIETIIEKLSLANSHISFTFIVDGNVKIKTFKNNDLKETIYSIYGNELKDNLIKVSYFEEDIKITGFICKPFVCKNNRNYENFFVNGRFVKNKILSKAVEEGYKTKLPIGKFPVFVLNIVIDPESIDVNVHPQKIEIKFEDDEKIKEVILNCIQNSLRTSLIPKISIKKETEDSPKQELIIKNIEPISYKPSYDVKQEEKQEQEKQEQVKQEVKREEKQEKIEVSFFNNYKIIGVFLDTYWIIQQEKSLYLIDQHAAHERILYDEYKQKGFYYYPQKLIIPIALKLTHEEEILFKDKRPKLEKMGFEIEDFLDSYAIRSVPHILKDLNAKNFLEILEGEDLEDIARKACKAAVKAHDILSEKEALELIKKLLKTPNPFTCPHGRPTIIEVTKKEIEKMFLRIV